MIRKLTRILALYVAILGCLSYQAPFKFQPPGEIPFEGGILQPFASSPSYDPGESEARQRLTIDERIDGTRSAPSGGAGLMQSWSF